MIRITDQYFWNFVFSTFFIVLVIMGSIILDGESHKSIAELTLFDFIIMTLATWRLIRLFIYDAITKFFREQFWNAKKTKSGYVLEKPKSGPRRTLADLFSCPWCFGAWAGAVVVFLYLLTPLALYPLIFLAVSAVATFLQLVTNLIGHQAERVKNQNERGF